MNKKKVLIFGIAIALFLIGIIFGLTNGFFGKDKKGVVSIQDDNTYSTLVTDAKYEVSEKTILEENGKKVAKFSVFSENMTADQAKDLAKKFYEYTFSKQKGLNMTEVYIGKEKGSNLISDFYATGLTHKVVVDKEANSLTLYTYDNVKADNNLKSTGWVVNDVKEKDGTVFLEFGVSDDTTKEAVMAQSKALIDQIKELNPDKEMKVAQATISNKSGGFQYNTGFNDVLATFEKHDLN